MSSTDDTTAETPDREIRTRVLDVVALKALAHPLRTQLWDALMTGPATASQLAEQLGESSGATSYHLRQLAKHGFIEEVPGRGTARERFWRIVEGNTRISHEEATSPASREAMSIFGDEWLRLRFRSAARYHERKRAGLEEEWSNAATEMDSYFYGTPEELAEFVKDFEAIGEKWAKRLSGRTEHDRPAGSRTIEVQFRAFPRYRAADEAAVPASAAPATPAPPAGAPADDTESTTTATTEGRDN
ncbi:ArsR/SmtB family transcription factor [Georgenia subflava]|uniref:Helix-turn-helix domain-containing protein n=1 Tax=Georgenia subflava TaxID=1622177 RepID=A0A6N7ER86_9MICO|nr:winged helix-turn-helix domain-containing protein [Georgenia subflava]MPV37684.1 helix-turn-helix domain-containing protein [Georgenia subflava]